jgi:hypothetical protein
MNMDKLISFLNPNEILVKSSNYLQCIIEGKFCEYQWDITMKKWYQFQTDGNSDSPTETFISWIELS